MGQFLYMKNKTGMKNTVEHIRKVDKNSGIFTWLLSRVAPKRAVIAAVVMMTKNPEGTSCCRLSSLPEKVKNLPSSYLVPLQYFINTGTAIIVNHSTPEAKGIGNNKAILVPSVMPKANIKFQNLSLFNHLGRWLCAGIWRLFCFIKSCMVATYTFWFKTYYYIISKIPSLMKVIVRFLLIISMVFPKEVVLATDELQHNKSRLLQIIRDAEKKEQIPSGLLESIAKIESGVQEHAININGKSFFAANKQEAISIINKSLNSGVTNIDIGVMQLNWRWHQKAFNNIDEMLSATINIGYAARLLKSLYKQHGDWHKAVRYYHSSNAEHYEKYSRKVIISWLNS